MNSQSKVHIGPDLQEVNQENVEFPSLAADVKLKLLPEQWPDDALPKPTSSLLSIANRNGLLAAAAPNALVIASTESIRNAFQTKDGIPEDKILPYNPELVISMPRLSHVVFSSDESSLTICADQGGGLQTYDTSKLQQGDSSPVFSIPTNNTSVRALVPNPAVELAHMLAVVLSDGKFMIADLKSRSFVQGRNGPVLAEGVSCVSWSAKGKQVLAGLGNGTAVQLKPDGSVQAEVPKPPQLNGDEHVSSLIWLTNDIIFMVYTPSSFPDGTVPDSYYYLITRDSKTASYSFQKLPEPVGTFGMARVPPHHFISRLRDWQPLNDLLVIASTASGDIGVVTCAKQPLSQDASAAGTAGQYTLTTMANDSKRATLPMGSDMTDTSPIGMCIDLSSKQNVKDAVPREEMDETSTPLPQLLTLNNQGLLNTWWIVYKDAIRQRKGYPGLIALGGQQAPSSPTAARNTSSATPTPTAPTFGSASTPGFGGGAFSRPAAPAFGQASTPGFGAATALGSSKSPWGAPSAPSAQTGASAFGKPAFGQPASFGQPSSLGATSTSGFGQAAALGAKSSPWASAAATSTSNNAASSPFGSVGASKPNGPSPFSNTSTSSPFGSVGGAKQTSLFGQSAKPSLSTEPSMGSTVTISTNAGASFGVPDNVSLFGTPSLSNNTSGKQDADDDMMDESTPQPEEKPSAKSEEKPAGKTKEKSGLFGLGAGGFNLNNEATKTSTQKEESKPDGNNMFGSAFTSALGDASKTKDPTIKEEETSKKTSPFIFPKAPEVKKGEDAPLPPDPTTGNKKSPMPEDAPLPPDPTATAKKTSTPPEDAPLPPDPSLPKASKDAQKKAEPALPAEDNIPLPPDPTPAQRKAAAQPIPGMPQSPKTKPKAPSESKPSPAGSSPVDLGASSTSLPPLPDAADLSQQLSTKEPPKQQSLFGEVSGTSGFGSLAGGLPPASNPFNAKNATTPNRNFTAPPLSFTPASTNATATKPPFIFSPPDETAEKDARSPSPVRPSQITGHGSLGRRISPLRSSSQSPTRQRSPQRTPSPTRPALPATSTTPQEPPPFKPVPVPRTVSKNFGLQPGTRLPTVDEKPSTSRLGDNERSLNDIYLNDELRRNQEELAAPIEPSRSLGPFLASTNYVDGIKPGTDVANTVERLYCDIGSMIDTLGLNARSLSSFVAFHAGQPDTERDRERDLDMGREEDWHLGEISDLKLLQKDLADHLESNMIDVPREKAVECHDLLREVLRLKRANAELGRTITQRNNPEAAKQARAQPLTTEQSVLLKDIRSSYAHVQHLLSQAEDSASVLRARLTTAAQTNGSTRMPTVEAVANTVAKMTRMVEAKSGDVDLLEAQMKRLGFVARRRHPAAAGDDFGLSRLSLASSLNGSPAARRGAALRASHQRGVYSLDFADAFDDDDDSGDELDQSFRASLSKSPAAAARRRMKGAADGLTTEEDEEAFVKKTVARGAVKRCLRERVVQRDAPRVTQAAGPAS